MSHVPGEMGSGLINDCDFTTSVTPERSHEASHDAAPQVSLMVAAGRDHPAPADAHALAASAQGACQWIGSHKVYAITYVFRRLGADFLLGANCIHRNGCAIDYAREDN